MTKEHQEIIRSLARMDERLCSLGRDMKHIRHALDGNGKDGLIIEVDRLKQSNRRRVWFERSVTGMVILPLLVTFCFKIWERLQ